MTEAEQIETQANTIKALWHRISRQQKRIEQLEAQCETQQAIIDWQEQQIAIAAITGNKGQ